MHDEHVIIMNGTFVESRKYIMLLKLQWALPKEKDTL